MRNSRSIRMNAIILTAAILAANTSLVHAQALDNGFVVTPLAAQDDGDGGDNDDRAIVDMNDFGQVAVTSNYIVGDGAVVDAFQRVQFVFPSSGDSNGTPIALGSHNLFGITNAAEVAGRSTNGFSLSPSFIRKFQPQNPELCGGFFPCNFFGFAQTESISFDAVENSNFQTSGEYLNQNTGEVSFANSARTKISVFDGASVTDIVALENLPAQYRVDGRLFGFWNGELSNAGGNVGFDQFIVFDDGKIAFVATDSFSTRSYVIEADKDGTIRELLMVPEISNVRFAINNQRQIAYVVDGQVIDPGVYLFDGVAVRQIYSNSENPDFFVRSIDLNDLGEVVIALHEANSFGLDENPFQLLLYRPNSPVAVPLATNISLPPGAENSQYFTPNRLEFWTLNNEGQVAINLSFLPRQAGLQRHEFTRLDPPGTTRENPFLPTEGEPCTVGGFCFRVPSRNIIGGVVSGGVVRRRFFDPVVAVGYDYQSRTAETRFFGFDLPPVGDGLFDLLLWDTGSLTYVDSGIDVAADEPFLFSTIGLPNGVERFSIRGIEVDAALDPDDPKAFVTGIVFSNDEEQVFEMIPIRFDPAGPQPIQVLIDIKPGSSANAINLGSGGVTPVAILSSASFDASRVDPLSVSLASAPARLKGKGTAQASLEDVNGDGRLDLVIHVDTSAFSLTNESNIAHLEGSLFTGENIEGSDVITVVR